MVPCLMLYSITIHLLPKYHARDVHRLDKDTTGLMVVAKTIPAQTKLVRDLQKRKSLVNTKPSSGIMTKGGTR